MASPGLARTLSPGSPALGRLASSTAGGAPFVDPLQLFLSPDTTSLANEIAEMPEGEPILQGFLRKEGTTRDSWKRRWFVLWRDRLDYLKKQEAEEVQGSIPIAEILGIIKDTDEYPQSHCFQVVTSDRLYAFQAPLEAAEKHWMTALAAAVYHYHYHPQSAVDDEEEAGQQQEEEAAQGDDSFLHSATTALFPSSSASSNEAGGLSARQMAAALQAAASAIVTHQAVVEATSSTALPKPPAPPASSSSSSIGGRNSDIMAQIEHLRALSADIPLTGRQDEGEDNAHIGDDRTEQGHQEDFVEEGEEDTEGEAEDAPIDMAKAVSALEQLTAALAASRQKDAPAAATAITSTAAAKSAKKAPGNASKTGAAAERKKASAAAAVSTGAVAPQPRTATKPPAALPAASSSAGMGATAGKKQPKKAAIQSDGPFEMDSQPSSKAAAASAADFDMEAAIAAQSDGRSGEISMDGLLRHFAALRNSSAAATSSSAPTTTSTSNGRPPLKSSSSAAVTAGLSATALAKVRDPEKAAAVAKAAAAALQNVRGKKAVSSTVSSGKPSNAAPAEPAAPTYRLSKYRHDYARRWVNSLLLTPPASGLLGSSAGSGTAIELPLTPGSKIAPYFRDGTLLCSLLETTLGEGTSSAIGGGGNGSPVIDGMNPRPRARAACLHNLERALQVIWKARVSRPTRIPTADELCDAREDKIAVLLPELMNGCGVRPLRNAWASYCASSSSDEGAMPLPLQRVTLAFHWLTKIASRYGPVPALLKAAVSGLSNAGGGGAGGLRPCPWTGVFRLLRDGLVLAQLAHYYGGDARNPMSMSAATLSSSSSYAGIHSQQKHSAPATAIDMTSVHQEPSTNAERSANWRAAVPSLHALAGPHNAARVSLLTEEIAVWGHKTFGPATAGDDSAPAGATAGAPGGVTEEDDDVAMLHLLNLFTVLSPMPCGLPEVGIFHDPVAAQDELSAGWTSQAGGLASGVALVPLFSLRIYCGNGSSGSADNVDDTSLYGRIIPTVVLPDGTEAAKVVVGHSYANGVEGWNMMSTLPPAAPFAAPAADASTQSRPVPALPVASMTSAAAAGSPNSPSRAAPAEAAEENDALGALYSSPMKQSPFPPPPTSAASNHELLSASNGMRSASSSARRESARSSSSSGRRSFSTARSHSGVSTGATVLVDPDAGLVQRILPFTDLDGESQPLPPAAVTAATEQPSSQLQGPHPDEDARQLAQRVIDERRRLLELSLGRARGDGSSNRGKSAAVIKLAEQWADSKLKQWAASLGIPMQVVEQALAAEGAPLPATSTEQRPAPALPVPAAQPVTASAEKQASPGTSAFKRVDPSPGQGSAPTTPQAHGAPGGVLATAVPLTYSAPRGSPPSRAASVPAEAARPVQPEKATGEGDDDDSSSSSISCQASLKLKSGALKPVVATLVATFPADASQVCTWNLRWKTGEPAMDGRVELAHLASVAIKQNGGAVEAVTCRLAFDKLHLSRAQSSGLLVVELLAPAAAAQQSEFGSFAASVADAARSIGLQVTSAPMEAALPAQVAAGAPTTARSSPGTAIGRSAPSAGPSPLKPATDEAPAPSQGAAPQLPAMKRQHQPVQAAPWPAVGSGAVLTADSGATPWPYPPASADPFAGAALTAAVPRQQPSAADPFRVAPSALPPPPLSGASGAGSESARSATSATTAGTGGGGLHALAARRQGAVGGAGLLASFLSSRGK